MPATAVTACLADGFRLEGGGVVSDGAGVLVVGGEAFEWRPGPLLQRLRQPPQQGSTASGEGSGLLDGSGRFDLDAESLGVLDVLWPRPGMSQRMTAVWTYGGSLTRLYADILIIGTGSRIRPLSQRTANMITDLGIRVEVLDTRNAAAQYNMLVQERGLQEVAAALIPVGLM